MKTKQSIFIIFIFIFSVCQAQSDAHKVKDELKIKNKIYLFQRSSLFNIDGFKTFIQKDESYMSDVLSETFLTPAPTMYKGYYVQFEMRNDSLYVVDVVQDTCKMTMADKQRVIPKHELFERFEKMTACKFNNKNEMHACWLNGDFYLIKTKYTNFMEVCNKKDLTHNVYLMKPYSNEYKFIIKNGILKKMKKVKANKTRKNN